jgi:uroporphyrinogen-III synthase
MMKRHIYLLSPTPREGAYSLPMIDFRQVAETIDFSCCDTLMFTSKQAVKAADAIDRRWKTYPCIAIGGATKKQIEALGGEVIYHPKHFYGEALAEDIVQFFSDRRLLYLRPKEVSFDSKTFLSQKGIVLHEQVIYETACVPYPPSASPQEGAIIIFTSPSTIHCFFRNFEWHPSYTAVIIGDATRAHLPESVSYVVAQEPLIDACIAKAQEILIASNTK